MLKGFKRSPFTAQHLLNAQAVISHQGINQDNAGNLRRCPTLQSWTSKSSCRDWFAGLFFGTARGG
jgi:hypothetical protein